MFRCTFTLSKSVLVTGSTKGLGNSLATKFIQNDNYNHVYVHGSSQKTVFKALEDLYEKFGSNIAKKQVTGIVCDFGLNENIDKIPLYSIKLKKQMKVENLVNFENFLKDNPIDEVVINHAITQEKLFVQLKNEDINRIMNINSTSYLQLARGLLNIWLKTNLRSKKSKKITTIGSILNNYTKPEIKGNSVYAMSKRNVEFLSDILNLEYGSKFPWLEIFHFNIPLLRDSSLVTNKTMLDSMDVASDTVDAVAQKVYVAITISRV
ncbi:hypothetical protein QEN19_002771 [Hanseniaspora menglaensis]